MLIDYGALQRALSQAHLPDSRSRAGDEQDGVCLILFDRSETRVLAIQKAAASAGYTWGGQVALPGGRVEATDASPTDAALRELHEELGVAPAEVDVLGELGHFQTHTPGNDLTVLVGRWTQPAAVRPDHAEVARVLEIGLGDLVEAHLARGYRSRRAVQIGNHLIYPLSDVEIWGVTARILHHFIELVLDNDVPRRPT